MTLSLLSLVRLLVRFRRAHDAPPVTHPPPPPLPTARSVVLAVVLADDDPATARAAALTLAGGWLCPCADCRRLRGDVVRALWRGALAAESRARHAAGVGE